MARLADRRAHSEGRQAWPEGVSRIMGPIWWLVLISWWLYPIAYLMPVLWSAEGGVVARQVIYTVADISSKVVHGVLLTMAAQIRSTAAGYQVEPMAVKLASQWRD